MLIIRFNGEFVNDAYQSLMRLISAGLGCQLQRKPGFIVRFLLNRCVRGLHLPHYSCSDPTLHVVQQEERGMYKNRLQAP